MKKLARALTGLVFLSGCTGWRVKDVTGDPGGAARAAKPLAARAVVDDADLFRRLQETGTFQELYACDANTGVGTDQVDVLVSQRSNGTAWADSAHPFHYVCFVGSALMLPPFWALSFIYLPWSPTSHLGYDAVCDDANGTTLARYQAMTEIELETQADGWDGIMDGAWQNESRNLARPRAASILAAQIANDSGAANKLPRATCPQSLSGAAIGLLSLDAQGNPFVRPPQPTQPATAYENDPAGWQNYWNALAAWQQNVPPQASWVLVRTQYALLGDNKTGRFHPRCDWVYTPLEGQRHLVSSPGNPVAVSVGAARAARSHSPLYLVQRDTLNGSPVTWVVTPYWKGDPSTAEVTVELYDGDGSGEPRDVVSLGAPLRDGVTRPNYLRTELQLTGIHVVFADGRPVKVELDASDPPLEPFLVVKESSIAEGRWRNHGLVTVKNKTLPRILRDSKTSELVDLTTRLEQICLDLSHEKELAKDDAQRLIERNQPVNAAGLGPDELREISLIYQGRVEILKAFVAGVKEELGNRNR